MQDVITKQVGAGSDDCFYRGYDGYFSTSEASFTVGNNGKEGTLATHFASACRFTDVSIPHGSVINTAHLTLRARLSKSATAVNSLLRGEAADTAGTFSDVTDYMNRVKTTAAVGWDAIPAWTKDQDYNSPELKTIVQEIINRDGWVSGNSLVLFWDNNGSDYGSDRNRPAYSYDSSTTYAPKLIIDYTEPLAASYSAQTVRTIATPAGYDGQTLREVATAAAFAGQGLRIITAPASYTGQTNRVVGWTAGYNAQTLREVLAGAAFAGQGLRIITAPAASYKGQLIRELLSATVYAGQSVRKIRPDRSKLGGSGGRGMFLADGTRPQTRGGDRPDYVGGKRP